MPRSPRFTSSFLLRQATTGGDIAVIRKRAKTRKHETTNAIPISRIFYTRGSQCTAAQVVVIAPVAIVDQTPTPTPAPLVVSSTGTPPGWRREAEGSGEGGARRARKRHVPATHRGDPGATLYR